MFKSVFVWFRDVTFELSVATSVGKVPGGAVVGPVIPAPIEVSVVAICVMAADVSVIVAIIFSSVVTKSVDVFVK